jgi:predicted alpha/beta superfamily hydrolase
MDSTILGEQRSFWIRVPDAYGRSTTARYPVFYLTDGDAQMLHTVATIAFLERQGKIPAMIVVGVGNTDRTRDLTPSRNADHPTAGGSARFLEFFEKELIPWVEARYRTQPFRVFAGHSFGGLFAVNAMATKPDLFRGIIAASPSLGWDDDLAIRNVEALFRARKELPVTLHVTAGRESQGLVSSVRRFEKVARKAPRGFSSSFAYHDDEDHGSIVLRTQYDGLRKIFADYPPPTDANGLIEPDAAALERHYANLSRRLGYEVVVPEQLANFLGYQKLGVNRIDEAIAIFKKNAERYPDSANVYDSLGEAYERGGWKDLARESYAKAVERSAGDPNAAVYRRNLERVSRE